MGVQNSYALGILKDRRLAESLRGEAASVAMDVGIAKLISADGIKDLVEAMRKHVFPQARAEAKELYTGTQVTRRARPPA